jgi:hypothetical protein
MMRSLPSFSSYRLASLPWLLYLAWFFLSDDVRRRTSRCCNIAAAADSPEKDVSDDDAVNVNEDVVQWYKEKRIDLEQDIHLVFELLLRHNAFDERNLNTAMTIDGSAADTIFEPSREFRLKTESERALHAWIDLVHATVPSQYTRLYETVQALRQEYDVVFVNYTSSGPHALKDVLDRTMTASGGYSADCRLTVDFGSSHYCSLWKLLWSMLLFHGPWSAERGIHKSTASSTTPPDQPPTPSLNNFVTIVQNYALYVGLTMTEAELDVLLGTEPEEVNADGDDVATTLQPIALWVGAVRNHIQLMRMKRNKALLRHTVTEADVHLAEWPCRQSCPTCWTTQTIQRDRTGIRPMGWNDTIVFQYIQLEIEGGLWATLSPERLVQLHRQVHGEQFQVPSTARRDRDEL